MYPTCVPVMGKLCPTLSSHKSSASYTQLRTGRFRAHVMSQGRHYTSHLPTTNGLCPLSFQLGPGQPHHSRCPDPSPTGTTDGFSCFAQTTHFVTAPLPPNEHIQCPPASRHTPKGEAPSRVPCLLSFSLQCISHRETTMSN